MCVIVLGIRHRGLSLGNGTIPRGVSLLSRCVVWLFHVGNNLVGYKQENNLLKPFTIKYKARQKTLFRGVV